LSDLNRSDCLFLGSNFPSVAESYFTIKAVNGQGKKSSKCVTGPYIQDLTPPLRPIVTPTLGEYLDERFLQLSYSNISDPESGISEIQITIFEEGKQPRTVYWANMGVVNSTIIPLNQDFPIKLNSRGGTNIVIGIRTINGFGLKSSENWTMINIPSN
jgi:hypothetical protein